MPSKTDQAAQVTNDESAALVKPKEAARALGFSEDMLKKARIHRQQTNPLRDLPFVRIGRSIRYRMTDIDAFIASHVVDPRGAA